MKRRILSFVFLAVNAPAFASAQNIQMTEKEVGFHLTGKAMAAGVGNIKINKL
jgi:hypothetical protein